ncbi:MAG: glycoside hydrolase family 3 C-terminal domain-containing protein, partial [Prolixibacteraceae bacterium]|nr:glycoside hydrolase family 3 C-terminal domain-containing protein [Prolixibacteraceae bacterium]
MKKKSYTLGVLMLFAGLLPAQETIKYSYQDTKLPLEERVDLLVSAMTLDEKIGQMVHGAPAIERLGVPEYNWWNECLHGVARSGYATVFPQSITIAASWDRDLMFRVADVISDEARAKHHEMVRRGSRKIYQGLTFWSPNINIFRDPRWGRGHETYGEDPYLTAQMGLQFVKGLQGDDPKYLKTVATAKHYAVHSGPEPLRHVFNAETSDRDLFETYLPAFRTLVTDGKVYSVMCAYNQFRGFPACASPYLYDILRNDWGFAGYVVSDCWAIRDFHENHKVTSSPEESAALALNNGCDLNCGCTFPYLTVAHDKGLVTEEAIDTALERLLRTRFKLGMFDSPEKSPWASLGRENINSVEHQRLALEAARKSMVLLKNDGNLLPLDSTAKKILLIGPSAANINALLANYYGVTSQLITPLEGLGEKIRDKYAVNMEYRQACLQYTENQRSNVAFGSANAPDMVVAVFGLDNAMEGEEGDAIASDSNGDRDYIELPPWQLEYLRKVKGTGKPIILVLTGGSPIAVPDDIADAIIFAWYSGEQGGRALADIIFGDTVPSGKLPIT